MAHREVLRLLPAGVTFRLWYYQLLMQGSSSGLKGETQPCPNPKPCLLWPGASAAAAAGGVVNVAVVAVVVAIVVVVVLHPLPSTASIGLQLTCRPPVSLPAAITQELNK